MVAGETDVEGVASNRQVGLVCHHLLVSSCHFWFSEEEPMPRFYLEAKRAELALRLGVDRGHSEAGMDSSGIAVPAEVGRYPVSK